MVYIPLNTVLKPDPAKSVGWEREKLIATTTDKKQIPWQEREARVKAGTLDPDKDVFTQSSFPVAHNLPAEGVYHRSYLEYLNCCYANHYEAVLRPDDVWYTLLTQLGITQKVAVTSNKTCSRCESIEKEATEAVDNYVRAKATEDQLRKQRENNELRSKLFSFLHGTPWQQSEALSWLREFVRRTITEQRLDIASKIDLVAPALQSALCAVDGVPFFDEDFRFVDRDIHEVLRDRVMATIPRRLKV